AIRQKTGKALLREARPALAACGLGTKLGTVQEAKIVARGAVERGNAGEAEVNVNTTLEDGSGQGNDLAERQSRRRSEEDRLGHATIVPAAGRRVRSSCRR